MLRSTQHHGSRGFPMSQYQGKQAGKGPSAMPPFTKARKGRGYTSSQAMLPASMDADIVGASNQGALRMLLRVIMLAGLGVMALAFLPSKACPVGITFLGLALYAARVISIGTSAPARARVRVSFRGGLFVLFEAVGAVDGGGQFIPGREATVGDCERPRR